MRDFFDKYIDKWVRLYSIIPLISCFTVNSLVYFGTMKLCGSLKAYDLTTAFDRKVPVIPAFIVIYLGCYLFWAVNYILIGRVSREHCMRFVLADIASRLICMVFFILLPTTNVRPEITGTGIFNDWIRFLYTVDEPRNLFPSIHCLVSWFCYIGIRGRSEYPKWYRAFSCIMAILICVSTQVTKQHYIVDVIGAVVIAELTYYAAFHTEFYRYPARFFNAVNTLVFGNNEKAQCLDTFEGIGEQCVKEN